MIRPGPNQGAFISLNSKSDKPALGDWTLDKDAKPYSDNIEHSYIIFFHSA